jgi:hypothetical protein
MSNFLVLLFLLFPLMVSAVEPRFEDYKVKQDFQGKLAIPRFINKDHRRFQTAIREGAKEGPNFSGHYTIVSWGCGTACSALAVVDSNSGEVFDGPFGPSSRASVSWGPPPFMEDSGLYHNINSRLLVVIGCPSDTNCGKHFYEWKNNQFRELHFSPLKNQALK